MTNETHCASCATELHEGGIIDGRHLCNPCWKKESDSIIKSLPEWHHVTGVRLNAEGQPDWEAIKHHIAGKLDLEPASFNGIRRPTLPTWGEISANFDDTGKQVTITAKGRATGDAEFDDMFKESQVRSCPCGAELRNPAAVRCSDCRRQQAVSVAAGELGRKVPKEVTR